MNDHTSLLLSLRQAVGARHVLTEQSSTTAYTTGYRFGSGPVVAVVRPGTLAEQWKAFVACIRAGVIVIVQAANTGLTGGSTPDGIYDRPVAIINTMRIDGIHLIRGGEQAVCMSGSSLVSLEEKLRLLGREPHSVIGSSCIGASVVGGVCNNSGGALVRRGPAYTEYAMYARVNRNGEPELCNHLGIELGSAPEEILNNLEQGRFTSADIQDLGRAASASNYAERVRDIDASTPARFNANPDGHFEVSGCAGKVMALAVRVDTFPADQRTQTFYIGTNDTAELTDIRRKLLSASCSLPVSAEYIHRDAYILAEAYGKDTMWAIEKLGTKRLPQLFRLKARVDVLARHFRWLPDHLSDRLMQGFARILPQHLPMRMNAFRDRFEHHLIVKVADDAIEPTRTMLESMFPSAAGDMFACTPKEAAKAFLHRFAVAMAAVRYRAIHSDEVEDIIALDVALRRNDRDWLENLPADIDKDLISKIYYGHFLCHVFHQDYIVRKGVDPLELEHRMWALLDARGAHYPAEHNVGHLYPAGPDLAQHYQQLDPCNCLNPGLGHLSKKRGWAL